MKNLTYYLLVFSGFFLLGCTNKNINLPVVDVTKSYPKKEILLQDIIDIDYTPLETRKDVFLSDNIRLSVISSDSILVGNCQEGSIFLFNKEGEMLEKFNHKGVGNREYQSIWGIFYNKDLDEVVVMDSPFQYRFQVYDSKGDYKRTMKINQKYSLNSNEIINYNDSLFLCYDRENILARGVDGIKNQNPYILLSKFDGTVRSSLPILVPQRVDATISVKRGENTFLYWARLHSIVRDKGNFILSEISKDTVFLYSKDKKMKPIAIRKPQVLKMKKTLSFFQIEKITNNYLFGKIIGKETKERNKFSTRNIMIDNRNKIYEYEIINSDLSETDLNIEWFINNDASCLLGADKVKEWLREGKLKGKLKEVARDLKEDDNPIWIRIKIKE